MPHETQWLRPVGHAFALLVLLACQDSPTGSELDGCKGRGIALGVGEVAHLRSPGSQASLCLNPGSGEAAFLAIPLLQTGPLQSTPIRVVVTAEGADPLPQGAAGVSGAAGPLPAPRGESIPLPHPGQEDGPSLHDVIRAREMEQLPRPGSVPRLPLEAPAGRPPTGWGSPPQPGERLSLNVGGDCARVRSSVARVVAVGTRSIVLADESNPVPGFSDAQLSGFGARFDQMVFPTLTAAFGQPTDLDGNSRVLLFFTRGVNEITPPGQVGTASGFFWRGDLFPRADCGSSNLAEVLYLAVPDPNGEAGTPLDPQTITRAAVMTAGHELQHLINSGRRMYETGAPVFEDTWLNEGMSLLAEELLFYAAAGLSPRSDLGSSHVLTPSTKPSFEEFGVGNIGRFYLHVQIPRGSSPVGRDGLETRGATWSFLRYVLDRHPGVDEQSLTALAGSTTAGLANLATVIGENPLEWMADWAVSVYADGALPTAPSQYQQPSWKLSEIIATLSQQGTYPLEVLGIGEVGLAVTLGPGNAAYMLFHSSDGGRIGVTVAPDVPPQSGEIHTVVLRVR